jgi:SAM-dependent methyltransferase
MIDASLIRSGYNQVAGQYADRRDQASSVPYLESLNKRLPQNSVALDVGCGAGLPVDRWLIDHGHQVIGLDVSTEMLRLARRNVPQARYELRDVAGLSASEYSVDAIVSFFALFHIDRSLHDHVLRRLRTCLEVGGLLLITTGRDDWEGEEEFLGVQMAWSHFDLATNEKLIEGAGFKIIDTDVHRGNSCGDDDWHPIFLAEAY